MLCTICQQQEAIEEDDICMHCFSEMADDMMYEYYEEFNPPTKKKCHVCGIQCIFTTVCINCLDSGIIPF